MSGGGGGYGGGASILSEIFGDGSCRGVLDCTEVLDRTVGIFMWIFLSVYMLRGLSVVCDVYLSPALDSIVDRLGWSEDTAGVTFLAVGSSMPELITSFIATFLMGTEGGIGFVVGSAVINILLIKGIIGIVGGKEGPMKIWRYPLLRDLFFYVVAIVELVLVVDDGEVTRMESAIMVFTYVVYCIYMKLNKKVMAEFEIVNPDDVETDDGSFWKWGRCDRGNHKLEPVVSTEACVCDRCEAIVKARVVILECEECDPKWQMCGSCFQRQQKEKLKAMKEEEHERLKMLDHVDIEAPSLSDAGIGDAPPAAPEVEIFSPPPSDDSFGAGGGPCDMARRVSPSGRSGKDGGVLEEPHIALGATIQVRTHAGIVTEAQVIEMDSGRRCKVRYEREGSPRGGVAEEWLDMFDHRIIVPPEATHLTRAYAAFEAFVWPKAPSDIEDTHPQSRLKKGERELEGPVMSLLKDPLPIILSAIMPPVRKIKRLVVLAILLAFCCTYMAYDSALRVGEIIRLPPRAVGMLLMASGTNFFELLASVEVARSGDGHTDISNAFGLPIFDILFGLGLPWLIRTLMGQQVLFHGYTLWLTADVCVLGGVVVVFFLVLKFSRYDMTRCSGGLLVVLYCAFVLYVLISGPMSIPPVAIEP
mmetsp:Transcript_112329/g.324473  ORF Transcript_112329/g.324473 Transcript_112329/m.324473 type:complete len:645 (-) Transcript_112329:189-2123(-)